MSLSLFLATHTLIWVGLGIMIRFVFKKSTLILSREDAWIKPLTVFLGAFLYVFIRYFVVLLAYELIQKMDTAQANERLILGIIIPGLLSTMCVVLYYLPTHPRNIGFSRLVIIALTWMLLLYLESYFWAYFAKTMYALLPNASFALVLLILLVTFVQGKIIHQPTKNSRETKQTEVMA